MWGRCGVGVGLVWGRCGEGLAKGMFWWGFACVCVLGGKKGLYEYQHEGGSMVTPALEGGPYGNTGMYMRDPHQCEL